MNNSRSKLKIKSKSRQSRQQTDVPSLRKNPLHISQILGPHPLGPDEMLFYWTRTTVYRTVGLPDAQNPYGTWEEAKFDKDGILLPPPKGVLGILEQWDEEDRKKREREERERQEKETEAKRRKILLLKAFRDSFVGHRLDDMDDDYF